MSRDDRHTHLDAFAFVSRTRTSQIATKCGLQTPLKAATSKTDTRTFRRRVGGSRQYRRKIATSPAAAI